MDGTMTIPAQPTENDIDDIGNDWMTESSTSGSEDADDFRTISNQLLGEGSDAPFYFDRTPAGLSPASPMRMRMPLPAPAPGEVERSPIVSARSHTYVDPLVAIKEMLWLLPDISSIVENTLERMGRSFAYNSVFLLKVVLDLQVVYLTLKKPSPPKSAILDISLVLRIAEVLSCRLTRKKKDNTSLSRELQLRTLISALTLLSQVNLGTLHSETYAQLLRDISERDAENEDKHSREGDEEMMTGDNSYLTRYACDLVRGLPADMPPIFHDLNQEAIHFLFAAGFINQLEARPSRKAIDALFARITAEPSEWHADMKHLHEFAVTAISLQHQAKCSKPTKASQFAGDWAADVSQSLLDTAQEELKAYPGNNRLSRLTEASVNSDEPLRAPRDAQMYICGMLDLLSQLVATFPAAKFVTGAVELALRLVKQSNKRSFRHKALEIIICSTVGVTEKEYYDTMRNLEFVIEETARARVEPDLRTEEERLEALERVEQLRAEKRDAMDRWEKKMALYTGASESIQRRLLARARAATRAGSEDDVLCLQLDTQWNANPRTSHSSSPPRATSLVPTLSDTSGGHLSDSPVGSEPATLIVETPTCIVTSPGESCDCCNSPTNTCGTCMQTPRSAGCYSVSSPFFLHTPNTPNDFPEVVPNFSSDELRYDELAELVAAGLPHLYEEPPRPKQLNNNLAPTEHNTDEPPRRLSVMSVDLPLQDCDGIELRTPSAESSISKYDEAFHLEREDMERMKMEREEMERKEMERVEMERAESDYSEDTVGHTSVMSHELRAMAPETLELISPLSTYPEPSISRHTSSAGTLRRRSRALRPSWTRKAPRLNKPLPPLCNPERSKASILAENAPEVVQKQPVITKPIRSQSAIQIPKSRPTLTRLRNLSECGPRSAPMMMDPPVTPMPPILDTDSEYAPSSSFTVSAVNYEAQPLEIAYKVHAKDSCFTTFITSDTRHAIYLSPHSFQVFSIPTPDQVPQLKPKFHYRLGDWEGLKKSKVPWTYKTMAVSDRYVATITKERLQVHDLAEDCRVIFNDQSKGWEYASVAISADRLIVGLSKALRGEDIGIIRIYRMNSSTYEGHRYERCGKDIHLPIHPQQTQDAPHTLSLTADGNFLTCGTPKTGYYFAWDITRRGEPRLITSGQLRQIQGLGPETLTGVHLFPDCRHLFCSTFPATNSKLDTAGCFTESLYPGTHGPNQRSIRQVSLRILHTALAPYGDAVACLSKNGTIWTTPMAYLEDDDNLTSFAPLRSKERLMAHNTPDVPAGKVAFSPHGERIVGVDKKGKIVVLSFPLLMSERPESLGTVDETKVGFGGYF